MDLIFIIWTLTFIKCSTATLYYSNTDNKTYYQAEQFCNRVGGVLLRYGGRFSEVIRTCEKFQTDVWTGKPWYRKWENCYYDGNINTLRTAVVNRTADKHVAVCADFCANENYTSFAVQTKSCFCYNEGVTFTASFCFDQTIKCPGNINDVCGTGEYGSFPYYVVYEKVNSLQNNICRTRLYADKTTPSKETDLNCNSTKLTYICRVGRSDEIKCNFNDLLQSKSSADNVTGGKGMVSGLVVGNVVILILIFVIMFIIYRKHRKNGQTSKSIMRPENNDVKKNEFSLYASVSEETIISGNVLSNDQANLVSSDSKNAKTDQKFISFDNTKTSNTEKEDHYEIKPDGVYDVSSHNAMNKMDGGNDNIYDRQLEDTYDTGNLQNINQTVDVYDHT
ncbi:uncharacterized protein LOC127721408 isoform X2 [Mytilus californianus]|uniref:uncharacterized protein LOC127721408 isoform X2 n=1 Tax=Mytilus californianus TaxID=6549 RepID=UPI0022456316|nr:uncharacterized protein LOC127721408 isoform X2 [Mytilus californianus]